MFILGVHVCIDVCMCVSVCLLVCVCLHTSHMSIDEGFSLCLPGGKQLEKAKHFQCIGKT